MLWGILVVVALVCAVVVAHLVVDCGPGGGFRQQTPCEDQAPPECVDETIEQASVSQFVRYRYCACMTYEGLAKGYIAADIQREKIN
jgi:hypothetical protein